MTRIAHVNRRGIRREGTYFGPIKHTRHYHGLQLVRVKFDGNKWSSCVPRIELTFLDGKKPTT